MKKKPRNKRCPSQREPIDRQRMSVAIGVLAQMEHGTVSGGASTGHHFFLQTNKKPPPIRVMKFVCRCWLRGHHHFLFLKSRQL